MLACPESPVQGGQMCLSEIEPKANWWLVCDKQVSDDRLPENHGGRSLNAYHLFARRSETTGRLWPLADSS